MKRFAISACLLAGTVVCGGAPAIAQAPSSGVGRRYPAEMRTLVDEQTHLPVIALTTSSFSDSKPYQTHTTWTSDGQWILFRSERGGNGQQAFVVNEYTGDIIQLTDGPRSGTGSLNLSRKAMKLYFMRGGRGRRDDAAARTPTQLIELNIGSLIEGSMAAAVKEPASYERVVATLPDDLRDSGGFGLDADETKAYWGVARPTPGGEQAARARGAADGGRPPAGTGDRDELLRRNSNAAETAEAARQRFAEAGRGAGGIRGIDLATGEISTVVDVDFRMGHVQANPWEPGEIIYCHETGGDAPQRIWSVRADGTNNRPLYVETPDEWITHETVATRDELMFNILGHLPRLREHPSGIAVLNLRTNHMKLLGQVEQQGAGRDGGFWHCNGSPDGRWAVGDTFGGNIWVIDRRTGKQTELTTGHRMRPDHTHPIFSADSKRVLIQSGKLSDGKNLNLMVVALPEALLTSE